MDGKIIIAIDAMGGDYAPEQIVRGVVAMESDKRLSLVLVGDKAKIDAEFEACGYKGQNITVVHAAEVITGDDVPTIAIRTKKDSSMVVGLNLVKSGEAHAFISAGNTGALLTGATLIVGRIKGIERPALGAAMPNANHGYTLILDCGANADCKPGYLAQFAKMGSVYAEYVMGIENPRVGLVNIGTEPEKGNTLVKEAFELLSSQNGPDDINFIGNTEASDVSTGYADVLVCDGFVGNVILKNSEGLARSLLHMIKEELMSGTLSKIGAILSKDAFKRLKKGFDASEVGGAPLLGLKALVVKAHGNSNSRAIESAIKQCLRFVENDIVTKIQSKL